MKLKAIFPIFTAVMAASIASGVPLALTEQQIQARDKIINGVKAINSDGLPGEIVVLGNDAFPLVCGERNKGYLAVAAAAFVGEKGRVVAFGHPAFLANSRFMLDSEKMICNALDWLSENRGGKWKVAYDRHFDGGRPAGIIRIKGIEGRIVNSPAEVADDEIFICYPEAVPANLFPEYRKFLDNGGAMLTSGLAWGWQQGNPDKSLSRDNGFNCILGPAGLYVGPGILHRGDAGYPVAEIPRGTTVLDAIELLKSGKLTENRAAINLTLASALTSMPDDSTILKEAITPLMDEPDAKKVPSVKSPLKDTDVLARLALMAQLADWRKDPSQPCAVAPCAAEYPGLVSSDALRLRNEKRTINLNIPQWHSLGLYLPAGEKLTVKIPPEAVKWGLQLRVGTSSDDIFGKPEWRRAPVVSLSVAMTQPETTVYSPFGGLVYISVPFDLKPEKNRDPRLVSIQQHTFLRVPGGTPKEPVPDEIEVVLNGAVRSPLFRKGVDDNASWAKQCRDHSAPQAELMGEHVILTVPEGVLPRMQDAERIIGFWDQLYEDYAWLADVPAKRRSQERICYDVQLSAGDLHNGYPMMFHLFHPEKDEPFDPDAIAREGNWGLFHEIGHNHQSSDWTWNGFTEVSVNIFSLFAMERYAGLKPFDEGHWGPGRLNGTERMHYWVNYPNSQKSFQSLTSEYFRALEFFMRLSSVYGWDAFQKVIASYHNTAEYGPRPRNDQEKRDQFIIRFSRVTGENLAPFAEAFCFGLSDSAKQECAKYKEATAYDLMRGLESPWPKIREAAETAKAEDNSESRFKPGDSVVFLGDSITEISIWGSGYFLQFKNFLKEIYPDREHRTAALGRSGTTVFDWRSGMLPDSVNRAVQVSGGNLKDYLNGHLDHVFVMLGMNDLLAPTVRDTPESVRIWKEAYRDIIRDLKRRTTPRHLYLCNVTPLMDDPNGGKNRQARHFAKMLDELAKEEGCERVETDKYVYKTIAAVRKRAPNANLMSDFVHPRTWEANEAILLAFVSAMKDKPLIAAVKTMLEENIKALGEPIPGAEAHPKGKANYRVYIAGDNPGSMSGESYTPDAAVPDEEADFVAGRNLNTDKWRLHYTSPDYPAGNDPDACNITQISAGAKMDTAYAARWIYSDRDRKVKFTFTTKAFMGAPACKLWVNGEDLGNVTGFKDGFDAVKVKGFISKGWNRMLVRVDHKGWNLRQFSCHIDPDEPGDSTANLEYSADPK